MYCPYCRCYAPSVSKQIGDTGKVQILPACCFQFVDMAVRDPHVLERREMIAMLGARFPNCGFQGVGLDALYCLCAGAGLVSWPPEKTKEAS